MRHWQRNKIIVWVHQLITIFFFFIFVQSATSIEVKQDSKYAKNPAEKANRQHDTGRLVYETTVQ